MKIVMIPSGFKECLSSEDVALAMEKGAKNFDPTIKVDSIPMIDGGEGFAKAVVRIKNGVIIQKEVTGPVGEKVDGHYGIYKEDKKIIAVIEMAAVAGLKLVPGNKRNPLKTTTFGIGELIMDALDRNVDEIIIGCGDSGTSDGGAGMARALGARFLDEKEQVVHVMGGIDLLSVKSINVDHIDSRLQDTTILVACNWKNVLCGNNGVARVFGPQKGASPEQVEILSSALEHYAALIEQTVAIDVRNSPGSGASGGLGTGLIAFANAKLYPRFKLIKKFIQIEEKIASADLILTAEGSLDFQSVNGKIPCEVARIAKKYDIPVIAITGSVGKGAKSNYDAGIDAYSSIIQKPVSLKESMDNAPNWIEDCTEGILRKVFIGIKIADNNLPPESLLECLKKCSKC